MKQDRYPAFIKSVRWNGTQKVVTVRTSRFRKSPWQKLVWRGDIKGDELQLRIEGKIHVTIPGNIHAPTESNTAAVYISQ